MATVSGLTDAAAEELALTPGVRAVERDISSESEEAGEVALPAETPETPEMAAANVLSAEVGGPSLIAATSGAAYYSRQWNLRAIGADVAWARGEFGSAIPQNVTNWEFHQVWNTFRDKATFYWKSKVIDLAVILNALRALRG